MRASALLTALCCGLVTPASADMYTQLNLARTNNVEVLVLCSQRPEFNADRVGGFVAKATKVTPGFWIIDGPRQFPPLEHGQDPVSKALIVVPNGEPDQNLKSCINETVPFGETVFDTIVEAQTAIGKQPQIPEPYKYGPVRSSAYIKSIEGTEWVLYIYVADLPNSAAVNEAMMLLFDLHPDGCSENAFCLPKDE